MFETTVKPLIANTSLKWTPPYYERFQKVPKINFCWKCTSLKWTPPYSERFFSVPMVFTSERFYCTCTLSSLFNNRWGLIWRGSTALVMQTFSLKVANVLLRLIRKRSRSELEMHWVLEIMWYQPATQVESTWQYTVVFRVFEKDMITHKSRADILSI